MAKKVMFFTVGSQIYGLDVDRTQGIEKAAQYLQVPNTVKHIMGIMTLRGEVIPVYSLRTKFGIEQPPITKETQLIIGKLSGGINIALAVDGIKEISEMEDSAFSRTPALLQNGDTGYIEKVIQTEKMLAIMIGLEGLLTKEEKKKLKEFIEDNQLTDGEAEEKDNNENKENVEEKQNE